jgi:hypothetical protein
MMVHLGWIENKLSPWDLSTANPESAAIIHSLSPSKLAPYLFFDFLELV